MFSGRENPRGTTNVNMENLFVQIFERKRRIVEQVKQQVDLYDQHLATKCLLAGVTPPPWLWSPSQPSQTSELNKEEIITGLLFPQSRPSIICPSSRPFSYQKPVSFLTDNVVRQDLTTVVNNPLEEQLLEEEQQQGLSHNVVRRVSNISHEQDANTVSPRDVHGEEGLPGSVSTGIRENQSCPSPKYSQNQRVENSIDAISLGRSQGKVVPKSVSTTGCERKPSSPGYCQDETEANPSLDPGLSLAKFQRSKSRQKAMELRSSAKASNSGSNSRNEFKPSPGENISFEIASLRFENDDRSRDEVENRSSQGKGGDHCIKFSSTTESSTPPQKVESVQKYSSGDAIASIIPVSQLETGHVNEMDVSQSIDIVDEVSVKVDEQVDNPQSTSCNETSYLDGDTRSKSSHKDSSKKEHQKSSNSFSSDFPSRNSNPSPWTDHEVEFPLVIPMTNDVSMVTDAGMSIFQSEQNRSKTKYSGSVESTSIDVEPIHSGSLLQSSHAKESLIPFSDIEGFVVENVTSDNQSEEKGECVDTNRCPRAGRVSQTGISTDETEFSGAIRDSLPKTELVGYIESSSVELQSKHSAMQSDDASVLLKPVKVTGEALLVEEDNIGESIEISSISKSRSLSQTDITVVEPIIIESILQESSTPEDLVDHSKRCDIICGSTEVQPQGSLTKAGSNQCHGRITRPRSSVIEEESENEFKPLSAGSDHKSAEKQLEVSAGNSLLRSHDLPVFDNDEEHTMEGTLTPASTARMFNVPSLTDSEVNLAADNEMNHIDDSDGLKNEVVSEMESPASHSGMKAGENEPPESNTFAGHINALAKRPQHETSSGNGFPSIKRYIACTETGESHGPESSIQEFLCPSSSMGVSQLQNKRRRILEKRTSRVTSSTPEGDVLDSGSVREKSHHLEEGACHNLDYYDAELQKMIGSASSDQYCVELQKMIGSSSSAELRFEEGYLFKEAGLVSPASLSCRPEQLSVQAHDLVIGSEDTNFLPCAGEASRPLASCVVRDSDDSSRLPPLGFIGSDEGSPPVLEGFIIQTDDENESGSADQRNHDSFHYPRTTVKSATVIKQISKSACMTTPSLHLAKTFKFDGKFDLDQSVSTELFDGMFSSQNLEGDSVFDNLGINQDYTGRSYTDCLPFSGAGSSADARNIRMSPTEKLWHRILQNSSSSEKRSSQTPDLPCISEENENEDGEAENLCTNTPKSIGSEKRGSSIPDLPCIAEENENIDAICEVVNETSDSEKENVYVEMKPLGDVNEDPMKLLPSVSEAKIPVDRYSIDSVSTAFSFSATCNNSVKSKAGRKNAGSRRFTGKGKQNQSGAGGGRIVRPPSSRFSKAKLSCNSSLTTLGPRLAEKEPRHNNIVSNMTSFVPLVQQHKPVSALITGKRDVKVKSLEAAEASKRIAEQKENNRKLKKEAMKLERARQEQENLRKQEMEKKKKEEDRKKKEAEMAYKQEMEKKKKEEDRKRKEFEMADRKRQREQDDKKLKEAKRQRVAEIQKQQREAEQKLQAEKETKRQAMDAKMKAQKELKGQSNAETTVIGHANTKIPELRSKIPCALKSNSSDEGNASRFSRDADFKVLSNPGNMSEGFEKMEESYDISPYKCSDDEMEDEEDDNNKFVPTWARKSNVGLTVVSYQNHDPTTVFSRKSFGTIGQVLLPPRFKSRF